MTTAVLEELKKALVFKNLRCKSAGKKWIVEGFASTADLDHTEDIVTDAGINILTFENRSNR